MPRTMAPRHFVEDDGVASLLPYMCYMWEFTWTVCCMLYYYRNFNDASRSNYRSSRGEGGFHLI
jgi:hypothetical protein